MDAAVKPGKQSGAYSAPTVPDVHPYIMLNYAGTPRDVATLAHELGHGVHHYLARRQGYFNAGTPLTIADFNNLW
ncbi:MAG: M3 family metallopeptidase [Chlorobi bacterium]|nr:M3 family metallopeptidase [Chlorobiota bacterium]